MPDPTDTPRPDSCPPVAYTDFPLRDRFALTFMDVVLEEHRDHIASPDFKMEKYAAAAYAFADAMMEARKTP